MPEVNFGKTGKLDNIAGISSMILSKLNNGSYPNISYQVFNISDIKPQDLKFLPRESYLTIKYTKGRQYSPREVLKGANEFMKLTGLRGEIVGSQRRQKSLLNDIDILSQEYIVINPSKNIKIIRSGLTRIKLLFKPAQLNEYFPIDILFTIPERYPYALLHFTGSKEFNIHMSKHAIAMGYKLSVNGLFKNEKLIKIKNEKEIFKKLNMKYIEPKDRN